MYDPNLLCRLIGSITSLGLLSSKSKNLFDITMSIFMILSKFWL